MACLVGDDAHVEHGYVGNSLFFCLSDDFADFCGYALLSALLEWNIKPLFSMKYALFHLNFFSKVSFKCQCRIGEEDTWRERSYVSVKLHALLFFGKIDINNLANMMTCSSTLWGYLKLITLGKKKKRNSQEKSYG